MSRDSVVRPIRGMVRARAGNPDGESWSALLVWRVRFWLLALAVGLLAGHARIDAAQLQAARTAASQAGCLAPTAKAARTLVSSASPAPARKHCPI